MNNTNAADANTHAVLPLSNSITLLRIDKDLPFGKTYPIMKACRKAGYTRYRLRALRAHFPEVPLVIAAEIGVPSHAAQAMELGFAAVLINTAVEVTSTSGKFTANLTSLAPNAVQVVHVPIVQAAVAGSSRFTVQSRVVLSGGKPDIKPSTDRRSETYKATGSK